MTSPLARSPRTKSLAVLAAITVAALALAGCGPTLTSLEQAQQNLTDAEAAVASAEIAFAEASTEFCSASEDYVLALDVYSDVLVQTEPTVGDVQNAGSDLVEPREDALGSAQAAVEAQRELVTAQLALIDAQEAFAIAAAGPSGEPSFVPPTAVPSISALAPAATVDRVKQAEKDFAAVVDGIDADTPLSEASEEFRAAAVGLQLAWIRLFVDTGCASESQIQSLSAIATAYTIALQQALTDLGHYTGAVDGIYGPQTTQAVVDFQTASGLPATGTMDAATLRALSDALEAKGLNNIAVTAAIQQTLSLLGFWDGPIDGMESEELTAAIMAFQTALGVPATGEVDAATVAAFHQAIADFQAGQAPEPEPEPSAEPEPSPSPEPSETLAE